MQFGPRNDVRSRESVKIAQHDETNAMAATKMPNTSSEILVKCSQRQVFAKPVPPPYKTYRIYRTTFKRRPLALLLGLLLLLLLILRLVPRP